MKANSAPPASRGATDDDLAKGKDTERNVSDECFFLTHYTECMACFDVHYNQH